MTMNRKLTTALAAALLVGATYAGAVTGAGARPPARAAHDAVACDDVLSNAEAGYAAGKLTEGWLDSNGMVRKWPKVEGGNLCAWQGAHGQLTLSVYLWSEKSHRKAFSSYMLCSLLKPELCAGAKEVREETDARLASILTAHMFKEHAEPRYGHIERVPGRRFGLVWRVHAPAADHFGTFGWDALDSQVMIVVTFFSFTNPGDQAVQSDSVQIAIQQAEKP
jgi:hypothetical protein